MPRKARTPPCASPRSCPAGASTMTGAGKAGAAAASAAAARTSSRSRLAGSASLRTRPPSEGLQHANAILARRAGIIEPRDQRSGIMLIGEVRAVQGQGPRAVRISELRAEDVALGDAIAAQPVLE